MIHVEGIGKRYRITEGGPRYGTLRDTLAAGAARLVGRGEPRRKTGDFWAVRDVSFDVAEGEVVGIIGRNGAGKSTLLKILSRIMPPTEGHIRLRGRVASLLEVGTGFHPELTGRENIFMNGAVLGMRRGEIRQKFDEIVAFSEVEKFLETPVKHYSSGMYVRLAFAVAAHLEPEILIVDEVLAVGDADFQKKCLGKMGEVAKGGRTVLFVSHNVAAVSNLCSRAVLLANGRLETVGNVTQVLDQYLLGTAEQSDGFAYVRSSPPPDGAGAWMASATLRADDGTPRGTFRMTESIQADVCIEVAERGMNLALSIQIKEPNTAAVCHFPNVDAGFEMPSEPGTYRIHVKIPPINLYPGQYVVRFALTDVRRRHQEEVDTLRVQIEPDVTLCQRPLPRQAGIVFALPEWTGERVAATGERGSERATPQGTGTGG